ncbi:cytochrome c3 family protein [Cytophagales bacterium LB-30]|uniref:Cytochrome c3 family protein n=1 Tax=Shiella aurantiaca TaxID=3058365 RepID=A0ABT8F3X4_9BACT|nr:c-type cytochrome [Shiella aurantiaca]MDN4165157.1 cytochrome c3 family protein [Shiella aurantiaca]
MLKHINTVAYCKTVLLGLLILSASIFSPAVYAQDANAISTDPAVIQQGEALFKANCKVCHAVNEQVVGPALAKVYERQNMDWIIAFVRNSQKVIQSGDPYAVELYNKFNKTEMTAFDFSDDEIKSIIAYVKQETENPTVAAPVATATDGATPAEGSASAGMSSEYFYIILVVLFVVLVLILIVLGLIVSVLTKFLNQQGNLDEADKEIVNSKTDLGAFMKSKAFVGFAIFIFVTLVAKTAVDGLFSVGIQQGYAPKQPIAFSHQLHAGQLEIDCNYCHTGVRISKSANIPSANICMNCHSIVKTGPQYGEVEIAKIYKAVETNTPIEWVRIHNLPDLAYFNHAQHVEVGNVECQTCHGEIQTMEVVQQHALLTMGWCIDCHRKTDVNTADNGYYDKLVELHNESSKSPMKVVNIGGLECSKCHY